MEKGIENYLVKEIYKGSPKLVKYSSVEEYAFLQSVNFLCYLYATDSIVGSSENKFSQWVQAEQLEDVNTQIVNLAALFYGDIILSAANLKFYLFNNAYKEIPSLKQMADNAVKIYVGAEEDLVQFKDRMQIFSPYLTACLFEYDQLPDDVTEFFESVLTRSFISLSDLESLMDLFSSSHQLDAEVFHDAVISYLVLGIWKFGETGKACYDFRSVVKTAVKGLFKSMKHS